MKITRIQVDYHLKVPRGKRGDVDEVLAIYLKRCPAAQSIVGCIQIVDHAVVEELG